uniref:Putative secreted peptide n=1 Tax=Anopheles braziliensis TaxID=58242 RepID=A0A2M3ZRT7_9DIPT
MLTVLFAAARSGFAFGVCEMVPCMSTITPAGVAGVVESTGAFSVRFGAVSMTGVTGSSPEPVASSGTGPVTIFGTGGSGGGTVGWTAFGSSFTFVLLYFRRFPD